MDATQTQTDSTATPAATDANQDAPPAPATRKPKPADQVHIVHYNKTHFPAVIDLVHPGNLIDVTFTDPNGQMQRYTSSPFDPTGTKPDSWHFPEE